MTDPMFFGVIGVMRSKRTGHAKRFWSVCFRGTVAEAENAVKTCEAAAEKYQAWELKMRENNSPENYADLIDAYIQSHAFDPCFEVGCTYEIMCFRDDPRGGMDKYSSFKVKLVP